MFSGSPIWPYPLFLPPHHQKKTPSVAKNWMHTLSLKIQRNSATTSPTVMRNTWRRAVERLVSKCRGTSAKQVKPEPACPSLLSRVPFPACCLLFWIAKLCPLHLRPTDWPCRILGPWVPYARVLEWDPGPISCIGRWILHHWATWSPLTSMP